MPSIEVLEKAASSGAVGFVTGSIDDKALAAYLGYDLGIALTGDENVPMSLVVTEGFGKIPMAERTSTLLKEFNGAEVSINGATQVRAGALRPEIIISHAGISTEKAQDQTSYSLEIGRRVRIIRVPYFGQVGTVSDLPHQPVKIETGAHTRVLRAKLESGEEVVVPRANVELI